ncbi:MAG: zinc ribbon domain-containing protein [Dehalococcoidia bacterium]|nr:zinc ribbon domain-containing protein [Dehalococcoidia bacterium]
MPQYEYRCRKCGADFELIRRIADLDKPVACITCKSKRTYRRLSMFAVGRSSTAAPASDALDLGSGDDHGHSHGDDDFGGMGGDDWDDDF